LSGDPQPGGALDPDKRKFLKAAAIASGALALVGAGVVLSDSVYKESQEKTSSGVVFPRVRVVDDTSGQVANVNTLQVNSPLTFNYPLTDEPSIIVKLGQQAMNGVGPDGDIVAFSLICQHLGCILDFLAAGESPSGDSSYSPSQPVLFCYCHPSIYDLLNDAALEPGSQAHFPVPRVVLEVDNGSGDIYATSMTLSVIFGLGPVGSTDLSLDLKGGTPA
jgi:arsenite oxidase small subunit